MAVFCPVLVLVYCVCLDVSIGHHHQHALGSRIVTHTQTHTHGGGRSKCNDSGTRPDQTEKVAANGRRKTAQKERNAAKKRIRLGVQPIEQLFRAARANCLDGEGQHDAAQGQDGEQEQNVEQERNAEQQQNAEQEQQQDAEQHQHEKGENFQKAAQQQGEVPSDTDQESSQDGQEEPQVAEFILDPHVVQDNDPDSVEEPADSVMGNYIRAVVARMRIECRQNYAGQKWLLEMLNADTGVSHCWVLRPARARAVCTALKRT